MATIIKKTKKGRHYYYAVECQRKNGKPRITWQKYLGTLDAIILRAEESPPAKVHEIELFEAGGIAAILNMADKLNLIKIIDEIVPKREQGVSVGHYMILAAINRVLSPCSKLKMSDWYEGTVLQRLWRFPSSAFTSQRFWDHMDLISEEQIDQIQEKVAQSIKESFKLDPTLILYDTTNFFTYIATSNERNTIAKRGKSKQRRNDLRQVGLALLATKNFHIPLFHAVYEGNVPDSKLFPEVMEDLKLKYIKTFGSYNEATLVFDKGNISEDAMEALIASGQHFVAAIPRSHIEDFFSTSIDKFSSVQDLPGTKVHCDQIELWHKSFVAVLTYTESLFTNQLMNITIGMQKCQNRLRDLQCSLKKDRHKMTLEQVKKSIQSILSGQYLKDLFRVSCGQKDGKLFLSYDTDKEHLEYLSNHVLGRTLIITTRERWTAKEIVEAYWSQNSIENAFKDLKHQDYLHWQPEYHWTDQKIKVHGLYCILALLLATLSHKTVSEQGIEISLPKMLDELSKIREVALIYEGTGSKKNELSLSKLSPIQKKLAECLQIGSCLSEKKGNTKK